MKTTFKQVSYYPTYSKFFIAILLIFSFLSCSDEDSTENLIEKSLELHIEESIQEPIAESEESLPEETILSAREMLVLVNELRAVEGLNSLILNEELNEAAYGHSLDMEINDYFAHTGLDGSNFSTRTRAVGYRGTAIGENLARGQRTPEAAHNGWVNSEGHLKNILSPRITEMGLGVSGVYWTQVFGKEN